MKQWIQTGQSIVGNRWKCMTCANYDLCNTCHSAGVHDGHQMLKIEHPEDTVSVKNDVRRILHFNPHPFLTDSHDIVLPG